MEEMIVLVDENDVEVGIKEKLATHLEGKMHRAVSVFLLNSERQMLLQQRALSKYHSGGLWTNTCCGHPRPGESPIMAAKRRLFEEMGISCALEKKFNFTYRAELDKNLIEHEFDHVFVGFFENDPIPNPAEASDWKWMGLEEVQENIKKNPELYTAWFKIIINSELIKEIHDCSPIS